MSKWFEIVLWLALIVVILVVLNHATGFAANVGSFGRVATPTEYD